MKTHYFNESKLIGDIGELMLEYYLTEHSFAYQRVPVKQQLTDAIDFIAKKQNKTFKLEVKTDAKSEVTNNLFVETEVGGKPGWFNKYSVDSKVILVVALPYLRQLWFTAIRDFLTLDLSQYKKRVVNNPKYTAEGYLLPMQSARKLFRIEEIDI